MAVEGAPGRVSRIKSRAVAKNYHQDEDTN